MPLSKFNLLDCISIDGTGTSHPLNQSILKGKEIFFRGRLAPEGVQVKHNKTKGWVVLDQIRTIDRKRVVKTFDSLTEKEIYKIKTTIQETYVD